jgi:hypothetical protein
VCPDNLGVLIVTRKSFHKPPKGGVFPVIMGLLMVLVETFFRAGTTFSQGTVSSYRRSDPSVLRSFLLDAMWLLSIVILYAEYSMSWTPSFEVFRAVSPSFCKKTKT